MLVRERCLTFFGVNFIINQLAPVDALNHGAAAWGTRAPVNTGNIGVFKGDLVKSAADAVAFPEGCPRRCHVFNQDGLFVDGGQDRRPAQIDRNSSQP